MPSRKSSVPEQLSLSWDIGGLVAGVDEAGRGPLAGPVVAAAVILNDQKPIRGLADSKALTARTRQRLHDEICARALCVEVAWASPQEIDEVNVLQATLRAMSRAVHNLRLKPARVLVDGNRLPTLAVPAQAIVKGDALVPAISPGPDGGADEVDAGDVRGLEPRFQTQVEVGRVDADESARWFGEQTLGE